MLQRFWRNRRIKQKISGGLLLSFLLSFVVSISACVREVKVPVLVPPPLCRIPAFHVQKECGADIDCLLTEFALTLQAEKAVADAMLPCKAIMLVIGRG